MESNCLKTETTLRLSQSTYHLIFKCFREFKKGKNWYEIFEKRE